MPSKCSTESFIEKAVKKYGQKYDYSNVDYIHSQTKTCLVCPTHGIFWRTPSEHLSGRECAACNKESMRNIKANRFLEDAYLLHGDHYNYDRVAYSGSAIKVEILCNKCNEYFWQTPSSHLNGHGHWSCNRGSGYGSYNEEIVSRSPNKQMTAYYLRFSKEDKVCYKVGIEQPESSRWGYTCRGWNIDRLVTHESTLYDCYCIEQNILMKNEEYIGVPDDLSDISGHTEFFTSDVLNGNYTFQENLL